MEYREEEVNLGAESDRGLGNHPGVQLKGVGWCFPREPKKCHLDSFPLVSDLSVIPVVELVSTLKKAGYSPQT